MYGSAYGDEPLTGEAATNFADFNDKSIRMGFIRKVYSILTLQLMITTGFIMLFVLVQPVRQFAYTNSWLFWVAFAVTIVCVISLACCPNVRRKTPTNFIVLFIFTLAESFLLGVASSVYKTDTVLMAMGACAAVCLALTLFALQTKWDFTMCGGALMVILVVFMVFGFIAAFFPQGRTVRLVYASLGAIIFSLYLIYDTQLMLGGKHKYSISPEEYIFAALNLYLDIVNIFIYLLTIIGSSRD